MQTGIDKAVEYRGYFITRKKDFGRSPHLIDGFFTDYGFTVGDGPLTNSMPGATWFQTVAEAKQGIDDLIAAEAAGVNFWFYRKRRKAAEKIALEMVQALTGMLAIHTPSRSDEIPSSWPEIAQKLVRQVETEANHA